MWQCSDRTDVLWLVDTASCLIYIVRVDEILPFASVEFKILWYIRWAWHSYPYFHGSATYYIALDANITNITYLSASPPLYNKELGVYCARARAAAVRVLSGLTSHWYHWQVSTLWNKSELWNAKINNMIALLGYQVKERTPVSVSRSIASHTRETSQCDFCWIERSIRPWHQRVSCSPPSHSAWAFQHIGTCIDCVLR